MLDLLGNYFYRRSLIIAGEITMFHHSPFLYRLILLLQRVFIRRIIRWYDKAASWAQSKGIITGYEDGRFGPNDPLTREQLALILYNYAKSEGYGTSAKADLSKFADGTSTSPWAQQAMSWAVGEGLLSGRGVNMLYPTGTATRAEVAQIMMNFCENIAK